MSGARNGARNGALIGADENRRQVLYWRLLAWVFEAEEQPSLEAASVAVVDDIGLPRALLDPSVSVDTVVQRFPALAAELHGLLEHEDDAAPPADDRLPWRPGPAEVRRAALVSKLLLNVFSTGSCSITASQLACWQQDAGWLKRALGAGRGQGRDRPGAGGLDGVLAGIEGDLV